MLYIVAHTLWIIDAAAAAASTAHCRVCPISPVTLLLLLLVVVVVVLVVVAYTISPERRRQRRWRRRLASVETTSPPPLLLMLPMVPLWPRCRHAVAVAAYEIAWRRISFVCMRESKRGKGGREVKVKVVAICFLAYFEQAHW